MWCCDAVSRVKISFDFDILVESYKLTSSICKMDGYKFNSDVMDPKNLTATNNEVGWNIAFVHDVVKFLILRKLSKYNIDSEKKKKKMLIKISVSIS